MDALEEIEAPATGRSSLDLLQAIYRCPDQPLSIRMKAAIAALPYEHPKLAVTAVLDGTEDLARIIHHLLIFCGGCSAKWPIQRVLMPLRGLELGSFCQK